jgi:EmrB/QacA subfamily drug resistance transporter
MSTLETKKRNQILLVLFLGVLMGALDIAIVGPALTPIQRFFGVNERTGAWIFTIYVLFNLIGTPLMAKLSDQFGRRTVYILDVFLFALGSLVVSVSPSFAFFLAGRAIQGFGAGGIFPVASAVIGDTFPPEQRGRALGLIGAVFGLAFVLGPILGGVILLLTSWNWLFIVNLPVAAVVIALGLRLLPNVPSKTPAAFDWAGMVVLGSGLAALAYGVNRLDSSDFFRSLFSIQVWPLFALTAILIFAFVQIERRAASPVVRLDLFSRRQMVLAYLLSAGAGLGESGLVFIPALAVGALGSQGITSSSASFLLMPVVLAMGFGSPVVGRLLDRYGSRVIIVAGTLTLASGMFLLGIFASSMALFIISGLLIGLGLSALLGAPVRFIMLNEASVQDRSVAQGVVTLSTSVGQLLAGAVVGGIAASRGGGMAGYSSAYLFIGLVALVLMAVSFLLKPRSAEQAGLGNRAGQPAAAAE